jgi:hypothetical protein
MIIINYYSVLKKAQFGVRSTINSQLSNIQASRILMQLAKISEKITIFMVTLKIKM